VGYLRDIRRLTVALSRARLGLYILGRREVFEACHELREAFKLLLERPDKLTLVTGEMHPSERVLADEAASATAVPGETIMDNVEHLGLFVFQMTNERMDRLREEQSLPTRSSKPLSTLAEEPVQEALPQESAEEEEEEGEEEHGSEAPEAEED
jgi:intron-binding protein aquarius